MRSLIDIVDFSVPELDELIRTACDISENPEKYSEACKGKKLATLFFEPSTRTRLSFEAAMLELGGNVIGFSEAGSSSASKGESMADTAKVMVLPSTSVTSASARTSIPTGVAAVCRMFSSIPTVVLSSPSASVIASQAAPSIRATMQGVA